MDLGDRQIPTQQKAEVDSVMETLHVALGEKYLFQRVIGCGGMGYIFLAEHRQLHSLVAFKVLQGVFNRDAIMVARFQQEAKAAAQLAHPNIIPIYDIGQVGEHNYFIMRYIEGEDLSALLRRSGHLPSEKVIAVGMQVADALQYAHSKGVIHRDIKPANILLDQHGNAVVTDFGIARFATSTQLTVQGSILGTPHYMSPEQVRGEDVDFRSDQYSLGAVLYHLLAGKHTYEGATSSNLIFKLLYEEPDPLERTCPDANPKLIAIIQQLLAKNPVHRFANAAEAAIALRKAGRREIAAVPKQNFLAEEQTVSLIREESGSMSPSAPLWKDREKPSAVVPPAMDRQESPQPGDLSLVRDADIQEGRSSLDQQNLPTPSDILPEHNPLSTNSSFDLHRPKGTAGISETNPARHRYLKTGALAIMALGLLGSFLLIQQLFFPWPDSRQTPANSLTSSTPTLNGPNSTEGKNTEPAIPPLLSLSDSVPISAEEGRQWQAKAKEAIREGRWTSPEGDNALFYFRELHKIDAFRSQAQEGIKQLGQMALETGSTAEKENRWEAAQSAYQQALRIDPQSIEAKNALAVLEKRSISTAPPKTDDIPKPVTPERGSAVERPALSSKKISSSPGTSAESKAMMNRVYTIEEVDDPPHLLHNEEPVYPPEAKKRGLEDSILVQALVTETGEVSEARTLRHALEDPSFEIAAVEAVKKCRFQPAQVKGQPVKCRHSLEIHFRLQSPKPQDTPAPEPSGKEG